MRVVLVVGLPGDGEVRGAGGLEPGEFAEFGDGDALDGVVHEQLGDEIARALREERRQAVEAV